ncbi:MAG: LysE family transporter [Pseudonocardia sp.]|nr:LysE family transporter [Pseudonocardia sp.]
MSFFDVLPLLVAWTVAVAAPGPDFLAVLRASTSGSRRSGLFAAAGVVSGMACWAMAALAGVSALLARYEHLYVILRLAGAAFLIVYGLTTLRNAWRRAPDPRSTSASGALPSTSGWRSWRLGLFTNLANPKALVFFGALFASLLPADADVVGRIEALVAMLVIAFAWFTVVALLASVPVAVAGYHRARRTVDSITGGLFVAVGGALARP